MAENREVDFEEDVDDLSKKRDVRQVVLGKRDEDIKEYVDNLDMKFSTYVKMLIRRDMNGGTESLEIIEARVNEVLTLMKGGAVPTVPKDRQHREQNEKSQGSG
ncbi:hypothetical protein GNF78_17065, partial [Clostridium perfringens]